MAHSGELPDRTLLKPSEVAFRLDVSPQTVYFWHCVGVIEGVKIGGRTLRIFASSLEHMASMRGVNSSIDPDGVNRVLRKETYGGQAKTRCPPRQFASLPSDARVSRHRPHRQGSLAGT